MVSIEVDLNDRHPNYYFTSRIDSGESYQAKLKIKGIDFNGLECLLSNFTRTPVNFQSKDTSCTFMDNTGRVY